MIFDTRLKGTPVAFFPNTSCDIAKNFADHNIVISLTFCMHAPSSLSFTSLSHSQVVVGPVESPTITVVARELVLVRMPIRLL